MSDHGLGPMCQSSIGLAPLRWVRTDGLTTEAILGPPLVDLDACHVAISFMLFGI